MSKQTTLFLSQSYKDTWEDYKFSLTRAGFACWDYIILTASNDRQAEGFRAQIEARRADGFLPERTHFAVIPDPDGKRVGSGGATLGVIKYIAEHSGSCDFSGKRILVIHSGGDSKRAPQYSALGKLFSPVPRELPNGRISTLFDEFLIAMSSVPSRIKEGMLLLSGDVLLLFNPLQIDFSGKDAAAISFKEAVETGKNHGVFLRGEDGYVKRFLHKMSVESLTKTGAVNDSGSVDIDTGAVIFSPDILSALFGLVSEGGKISEDKFKKYVNEKVRLSLYGDFLYPLAADSTLSDFYLEKPEGQFCDELTEARERVWEVLSSFRMKLLRLAPAKFIHFGTTREILKLMSESISDYETLGWTSRVASSISGGVAGYNSVLSGRAKIGSGCYLEVSYVHSGAKIGDNVLLSYVDIHNEEIPSGVVLHGLKQKDGKFVARIYGIADNPKATLTENADFLGGKLSDLLRLGSLKEEDIWDGDDRSIWTAKLYPTCNSIEEAVAAALNLYKMVRGQGDIGKWKKAERKSLCSGFNEADPEAIIAWDSRMKQLVCMDRLAKCIKMGMPVYEAKELLGLKKLSKKQKAWLEYRLKTADYSEALRLHYYIGTMIGGAEGDKHISKCFEVVQSAILENSVIDVEYNDKCKIRKGKHTVKLPLRVNWGGGWSDTPPYCNENGGAVLNCAILLDGKMPVEVTLEKIKEEKIIFESRDMNVYGEFTDIAPLQKTGDPYDPFALQKAALVACGIIPRAGGSLSEILKRLGGGFRMNSEVTDVPKGSGLGTSSILSGACVKAILEFMGIEYAEADLYSRVLSMEQIMGTGGGWQDQVGGLSEGVKYITTLPGLKQKIKVFHIEIPKQAMNELSERFALIYTGQRRLARNLLRDVVGRYVGNVPESLYSLNEIQKVAALMRFELERGHIDDFATLLDYHWELSRKIDSGSSNTLIDQIFESVSDLIDGKLVCGAGGGGFLQVVMKKGVTRQQLSDRVKEVFQDSDVTVYDAELLF